MDARALFVTVIVLTAHAVAEAEPDITRKPPPVATEDGEPLPQHTVKVDEGM